MSDGAPSGLYQVVESLPVSEAIKTQTGMSKAWITSIRTFTRRASG